MAELIAIEAMSRFGGSVLKTSLSGEAEQDLEDAWPGQSAG